MTSLELSVPNQKTGGAVANDLQSTIFRYEGETIN